MPTNTLVKPASTINAHNSASSARFTDASVRNPISGPRAPRAMPPFRAASARVRRLSPMKLSSTMKTISFQPRTRSASSSAINCAGDLVRGTRPFMTMMSQNSQLNGQPRENCAGIVT